MNSSVYCADRATHLRIVSVAFMASIAMVGFAISARGSSIEITQTINERRPQKVEIVGKEALAPAPFDARRI